MDVNAHNMDRLIANYVKKTTQEKEDEDVKPIPLNDKTEEEQREAFRQVVKNCRARAEKTANSRLYRYHTVMTTTDTNLSRNPAKMLKKVSNYLDQQGIAYFLILELNHPQPIWKYETECENEEEFLKNYDFTKNAYNCANRYAVAPLENENGYHIHALTDKKVDFTKWIKKYNGDPNNLYSEAFNYYESDSVYVENMKLHNPDIDENIEIKKLQQKRNLNYILKYVYYTKATVAPNLHIYRTNADVHDVIHNSISLCSENDDRKIEIYNKQNYENIKTLIRKIRKENNDLNSSFVKRIADTFYNALLHFTNDNDYNNVVDAFMECNYVDYMNILGLINEYDFSCNHSKHNRNYGDEEYDDDDVICYYYPINAVYTYLIQEHLCFYADLIWDIVR